MSQSNNTSLILINTNKGVTGALFGLAIVAFAIRSYVRIRIYKRVFIEDYLLLFAVICLCAATGLAYTTLQDQYASLQVILHGFENGSAFELLGKIPEISKEENAASTAWWLVIFPVKLAFLLFFRRLISRLRGLNIWWWISILLTVVAGLVCVVANWLTCPYFTVAEVLSCSGPSAAYRTVRDTAITTAMDIMTDLLILSFPFIILWRVRINVRQKIGLAFSLCLSCAMVVVALARIAGMRQHGGVVDIVWLTFWQQQECSIAVFMVSVSAFRSLFVASTARNRVRRGPRYSPRDRARKLFHRRLDSDLYDSQRTNGLPQIPSATLTGMSTIAGNKRHVEKTNLDRPLQSSYLPSDNHSAQISTVGLSAHDAELGFPTEASLTHEPSLSSRAEPSRLSCRMWWKQPWQSDTARTGYWDVMSLFRTGHTESLARSDIRSASQL